MPDRYTKIKASMRKAHPEWSEEKLKSAASATFNKQRSKGAPTIQEHAAAERRGMGVREYQKKRHSRVITNRDR